MKGITVEWIITYAILILCFLVLLGIADYLTKIIKLLKELSSNSSLFDIKSSLDSISSELFEINHNIDLLSMSKEPPSD